MEHNNAIEVANDPVPRWSQYHMGVDIEGVLRWPDNKLAKLFSDDSGQPRGGRYVRDWLKLQLAQGKRVLPMGGPCEGWSYQKGCPGHPCEAPTDHHDKPLSCRDAPEKEPEGGHPT